MYADFDYYVDKYGGTIFDDEESFNPCAVRASLYIDDLTMNKAEAYADSDRVKLACCAIAEQVKAIQTSETTTGAMRSQSVGSFSVTYATSQEVSSYAKAQITELARLYLGPLGLMYRGIDRLWD